MSGEHESQAGVLFVCLYVEVFPDMNNSTPGMRPVAAAERVHILDILRGFAIFGILAVNIIGFASPSFYPGYVWTGTSHWYDTIVDELILYFADGKFYTIFSFLFGLGFALQLSRAESKGRDVLSFYPRRLWALFIIGCFHAVLLWTFDILRLYALLGFVLLLFRKRSNRTLLLWTGVFLAAGSLLPSLVDNLDLSLEKMSGVDLVDEARLVFMNGSFIEVAVFQAFAGSILFLSLDLLQGGTVMALFLLGLLVGRMKFFERLSERRSTLWKLLIWGALVGLAGNLFFAVGTENEWLDSFSFTVGEIGVVSAYIGGLSLLHLTQGWDRILAPLGSVGRMALTNYILQSLVCSLIFNGYGLGLYERLGSAWLLGITCAVYLAQIFFSNWWLSKFQFGPLEWLWRSLTYRKRQPFRVADRTG